MYYEIGILSIMIVMGCYYIYGKKKNQLIELNERFEDI